LENYITSGPVLALDLAGPNAIGKWRGILGPTQKDIAVDKAPTSLRALYARTTTENVAHGSDGIESAVRELKIIFNAGVEWMIPKMDPAEFDDETIAEMSRLEELALRYAEQRPSRSILKQEYLETTVLPLVLEGLSWVMKERPSDPVEHLAMFLLKNNPAGGLGESQTVEELKTSSATPSAPASRKEK
jgi:hypothetical protein